MMTVTGSADRILGRLGSYTFGTEASDGPWLPARILRTASVAGTGSLIIGFLDGTSVYDWSARYARSTDELGDVLRTLEGGRVHAGVLTLTPPPIGDWVVEIDLDYPASQGSGVYYWRLEVTR